MDLKAEIEDINNRLVLLEQQKQQLLGAKQFAEFMLQEMEKGESPDSPDNFHGEVKAQDGVSEAD